jgi:hypothetical protein
MFPRFAHEGDVPFVQVAHRGDERNTSRFGTRCAQTGDGGVDLHRASFLSSQ